MVFRDNGPNSFQQFYPANYDLLIFDDLLFHLEGSSSTRAVLCAGQESLM